MLSDELIIKIFKESFEVSLSHIIKAPGRVNLIGEHTDYNGFPVMPISIPHTITIAISSRSDNKIIIKNTFKLYKTMSFDLANDIPHSKTGDWSNYVKAAVTSLVSHFDSSLRGMNALFHGDIPTSAGLSSSSALVVGSALALLAANHREIDSLVLAELMAYGEHYVGTQGGGMDQAICLLGRENNAVKIDFFPLRYSYVSFPENYSILLAHSLIRAAKTENALLQYNMRPAECRLATALINALYKPAPFLKRLGELPHYHFYREFNTSEEFVTHTYTRNLYSLTEIAHITGKTVESIIEDYLLTCGGIAMPVPSEGFPIYQRALHVLTEAERVEKSCNALEFNDIKTIGTLMKESHNRCDENYNIATPELNNLVSIMRESGAQGARLTGAGFGGYAIALVRDDDIQRIGEHIKELYYETYFVEKHPDLLEFSDFDTTILFAVKPSQGAVVKKL